MNSPHNPTTEPGLTHKPNSIFEKAPVECPKCGTTLTAERTKKTRRLRQLFCGKCNWTPSTVASIPTIIVEDPVGEPTSVKAILCTSEGCIPMETNDPRPVQGAERNMKIGNLTNGEKEPTP
jgi:ribosomal protein S27AE